MSDELDPLAADLRALLAAERDRPDPDPKVAERVLARAAVSLGFGPGGGGSGGSGGGGASVPPGSAAEPLLGSSALGAKAAMLAVATFVLGGLAGASLHAALAPKPAAEIVRVEPAPALGTTRPEPAEIASEAVITPEALPSAPAASSASRRPSLSADAGTKAHDDDLGAERALLAIARTAVARGRGDEALAALDRHARRFPNGRLAEERESLRIQALSAAGRRNEAAQRAADFQKQFPNSLQKQAIDTSLSEP